MLEFDVLLETFLDQYSDFFAQYENENKSLSVKVMLWNGMTTCY
jgi:hypothetical protein